jgi:hypothetical protein
MDTQTFDTLARSFASGLSRRSMLGRTARAALVSPLALTEMAARADGNDKKKDKDKERDKDKDRGQGQVSGPITVNAPGGDAAASAQTVVQTNNQVCAGNCDQNNQQVVDNSLNQAVLTGSPTSALRPPTYWIDLSCNFDAPSYRTVCTGAAQGQEGAPLVQKINLPRDRFCAVVLRTDSQPERRETVQSQAPVSSSNNTASAGNGGVANASADGGSVTIGDVQGSNDIAIDASGGNANADASGGDNNVAIAGSQTTQQSVQQIVEPSTLTIELEGNVVPGKPTTYWLDTEAGRRPAAGPTLLQVADETVQTGMIIVDTWTCPTAQPVEAYDWFGQCTSPATGMQFSLFPASGSELPLATASPDPEGRVRFANLPAGTYEVRPEGTSWCHAESDHVDANGNVVVEPQLESHVWSFVCSGGS